jgi:hypothetical protein
MLYHNTLLYAAPHFYPPSHTWRARLTCTSLAWPGHFSLPLSAASPSPTPPWPCPSCPLFLPSDAVPARPPDHSKSLSSRPRTNCMGWEGMPVVCAATVSACTMYFIPAIRRRCLLRRTVTRRRRRRRRRIMLLDSLCDELTHAITLSPLSASPGSHHPRHTDGLCTALPLR